MTPRKQVEEMACYREKCISNSDTFSSHSGTKRTVTMDADRPTMIVSNNMEIVANYTERYFRNSKTSARRLNTQCSFADHLSSAWSKLDGFRKVLQGNSNEKISSRDGLLQRKMVMKQ